MRHPFRSWLETQDLDEASRALFEEGLLCYAAGAYRAALVFSYLGILRSVANRLAVSTRPTDYRQDLWERKQAELREDSTWEKAAFESLSQVKPASLFLIDDDLRQQFEYWRGRRNDAAHARTNEISAPHVESLWMFFRSSHLKLVVAGGRQGLLERFKRHFDPSYTPRDLSFVHLVAEIPKAVRTQEYGAFLLDVMRLTGSSSWFEDPWADSEDDEEKEEKENFIALSEQGDLLLQYIQELNDRRLTQALVDELKKNHRLLLGVLLSAPNFSTLFAGDPSFLRKLWHDWLPFGRREYFSHPISRSFGVLVFLLRNGLIPESQQKEALEHSFERIVDFYPHQEYDDSVLEQLEPFGFWNLVRSRGFGREGNVDWLASNIWLGVDYLTSHPVDEVVARAFAGLVPEGTELDDDYLRNSNFEEPEDAYNLREYFLRNPTKLTELEKVALEKEVDIHRFLYVMRLRSEF